MSNLLSRIVATCTRHPWAVIVLFALLSVGCGSYAVRHFAIDTDVTNLISPDLPWRQRELALNSAFPKRADVIVAVVDAPTPELADAAANALTSRLQPQTALFRSVSNPAGAGFFRENGLLFENTLQVAELTDRLQDAAPLIGALAADPTLRGLGGVVNMALLGVEAGKLPFDDLARPLNMAASSFEDVLAGKPASFSWQALMNRDLSPFATRRVVEVWPVLDYSALQPGEKPTAAIRQAVHDLDLAGQYQANVRITGSVPIADEEFATLEDGALKNTIVTLGVVLLILWAALRSKRMIAAVFVTLGVGLVITTAAGLAIVGALNLISVAFAVLFVGLGVDFAIQYAVRYREERFGCRDLRGSLIRAAERAGRPLTLAAAAVAAGFFSFLPTDYRGISELGLIAGLGMLIAYATSVTLLPALLKVFRPRPEVEPVGFAFLAPVDHFLERHRIAVVAGTILVSLAGLPLLMNLSFDFNPMHLRNKDTESIATYLDLRKDPRIPVETAQVLAPSEQAAETIAERLRALPEVGDVTTLASLVPADQEHKLPLIEEAAWVLEPALDVSERPPLTDQERVAALRQASDGLIRLAAERDGAGPSAAHRLALALAKLAKSDPATRERAEHVLVLPLQMDLADLRAQLKARPVTKESLPQEIVGEWVTPDGRARVSVTPNAGEDDNAGLRRFVSAVLAAEPSATGGAVSIIESAHTVVRSLIEAGILAIAAVAVMLWIVLRRMGDVLLTLVPLIVAGAITLEVCVLTGLSLNFANIIALPLLLGVGVAFKIYYILAWRAGQTHLLQSSLTRAVIFSALTTATAFGSLWLSNHPGTSSMGKLLALSLACTMLAAVLFQPALMGAPREAKPKS